MIGWGRSRSGGPGRSRCCRGRPGPGRGGRCWPATGWRTRAVAAAAPGAWVAASGSRSRPGPWPDKSRPSSRPSRPAGGQPVGPKPAGWPAAGRWPAGGCRQRSRPPPPSQVICLAGWPPTATAKRPLPARLPRVQVPRLHHHPAPRCAVVEAEHRRVQARGEVRFPLSAPPIAQVVACLPSATDAGPSRLQDLLRRTPGGVKARELALSVSRPAGFACLSGR